MSKSSKSSRQSLIELENLDDPMGEDEFPIGLGCALDMFREKQEVLEILNSLPQEFTNHVAVSLQWMTGQSFPLYKNDCHYSLYNIVLLSF